MWHAEVSRIHKHICITPFYGRLILNKQWPRFTILSHETMVCAVCLFIFLCTNLTMQSQVPRRWCIVPIYSNIPPTATCYLNIVCVYTQWNFIYAAGRLLVLNLLRNTKNSLLKCFMRHQFVFEKHQIHTYRLAYVLCKWKHSFKCRRQF